MKIATIHGYATSTLKHPSLTGASLLIAVPEGGASPQIVVDPLGAGLGQRVLITSDGSEARAFLRDPSSPARWTVCGILDPVPAASATKEGRA